MRILILILIPSSVLALTTIIEPYKDLDYEQINTYNLKDERQEEYCTCPEERWWE
jgi:hypothetical protein